MALRRPAFRITPAQLVISSTPNFQTDSQQIFDLYSKPQLRKEPEQATAQTLDNFITQAKRSSTNLSAHQRTPIKQIWTALSRKSHRPRNGCRRHRSRPREHRNPLSTSLPEEKTTPSILRRPQLNNRNNQSNKRKAWEELPTELPTQRPKTSAFKMLLVRSKDDKDPLPDLLPRIRHNPIK